MVRGAATRLLRAWRATVNDSGSGSGSNGMSAASVPGMSVSRRTNNEVTAGGEGEGAVRAAAATSVSERGAKATSKPPQEKEKEKERKTERGDEDEDEDTSSRRNYDASAALLPTSDGGAVARRPAKKGQPQSPAKPKRPSLVPAPLWGRLSQEFNASQLTAIWAAAASQLEARQERATSAAATTATQPARVQAGPAAAAAAPAAAASYRTVGGGIVLLQGPPGTGKTRTILGVVSALLARREEKGEGAAGTGATAGEGCGGAFGGDEGGDRGMGTTLGVGARQKRPGVAGRWVAAKTHQRVSGRGARGVVFVVAFVAVAVAVVLLLLLLLRLLLNHLMHLSIVHFDLPLHLDTLVHPRVLAAQKTQQVLVCAPSNGAVDELTQRLALETGGVWDHRGKSVAPRVVRLGRPSEDSAPRVKAVSLEFMVEER